MRIGKSEVSEECADKLMERWGIPKRYRAAGLPEGWDKPLALESYFIHGRVGCGKTWLACAMMKANTRSGNSVFTTVEDMLDSIRQSFGAKPQYDEDDEPVPTPLDRYRRCGLLVLDDIGRMDPTDWASKTIFSIINHRYSWLLPMYITSNHSLKELASILGDLATVSRVDHMCEVIHLTGNKRRG